MLQGQGEGGIPQTAVQAPPVPPGDTLLTPQPLYPPPIPQTAVSAPSVPAGDTLLHPLPLSPLSQAVASPPIPKDAVRRTVQPLYPSGAAGPMTGWYLQAQNALAQRQGYASYGHKMAVAALVNQLLYRGY